MNHLPYVNLNAEVRALLDEHGPLIESWICYERDEGYDEFARRTLERSYLLKGNDGTVIERPQHMWMRVALGIHGRDLKAAHETYDLLSQGYATHATPTLFNAGTVLPQMSSCFLLAMKADSIDGIFDTLHDCARISKTAGGIGLHVHNVRAKGTPIHGTNGVSNGIVPMLRVFNDTARYVDQGGGRRKGSFAIYLEPWHMDIEGFLALRQNTGAEELRARDLFTALWVPDLFMERVDADADWTLFCPASTPDLPELVGDAFRSRYEAYEENADEGVRKRTVSARALWTRILASQVETGTPYVMFKDTCNRKSNQRHLGTIKSSNLCCEVVQYSAADETAVCNLASVALPKFVRPTSSSQPLRPTYDFEELAQVVRILTRNLNRCIDRNYYPTPEAERSNRRHRPIAIGVQGLADVFAAMSLPYETVEALELNRRIFETIYYAALDESCSLAERDGPYASFEGSPLSEGQFQFDLWGDHVQLSHEEGGSDEGEVSEARDLGHCDWEGLRERIRVHGTRNSLVTAVMPTASTAQILGNSESVDPHLSNLFTRRTLSGTFLTENRYLVAALTEQGLWSETMREWLVAHRGSIQTHPDIDAHTKLVFKTVWEIKQRWLIDHAAARGPFVDQAQSRSLYFAEVNDTKLSSALFYAWRRGLKTGMYYCRTLPKTHANAVTTSKTGTPQPTKTKMATTEPAAESPVRFAPEACEMCSA